MRSIFFGKQQPDHVLPWEDGPVAADLDYPTYYRRGGKFVDLLDWSDCRCGNNEENDFCQIHGKEGEEFRNSLSTNAE